MRRAKGIDALYEEVRDCDMVITNDAPLATALDARVDRAMLGGFARTPRQIAAEEAVRVLGRGVMGDLGIIAAIADETGFDFKYVHGELENIRTIRRYRENPGDFLYTDSAREVLRSFEALPTIEKVMAAYDPSESLLFKSKKRVAVIGLDLFDDLDKHFVPADFVDVDMFEAGEYAIGTIHQIGNDRQIADAVVDLIDAEAAEDFAVVIDTEGPIADAVRSALYRKGVPFKNLMAVKDLAQIRDYLRFLELALGFDTLRVRQARELFSNYGGYLRPDLDAYLLSKILPRVRDETAVGLAAVMRDVRSLTFGEVMEAVVHPQQRPQVRILLDELAMTGRKVTAALVGETAYAVNNVADLHHNEQTPDDERRGVLLADCNRSVYIDRPAVIFAGIGPEWSPAITGREYIDREAEAEKDALRFTVLMQQGCVRIYAVNLIREGRPARPCPTFKRVCADSGIEVFGDICGEAGLARGTWLAEAEPVPASVGRTEAVEEPDEGWLFSKSSYNRFRQCPRAYMFGDLVRTPDSEHTVFGSVVHEFAEFQLCYPELVDAKGVGHYLDLIEDRYSGISCEQMRPLDRTELLVSMDSTIRYLDRVDRAGIGLDRRNADRRYPNELMAAEGCEMYSGATEHTLSSAPDRMTGNFDLVVGNTIADYKTGKAVSLKGIRDRMVRPRQRYVEFQPLFYLALLHRERGGDCVFEQVYVRDRVLEALEGPAGRRIEDGIRRIELVDRDFDAYVRDDGNPGLDWLSSRMRPLFLEHWPAVADLLLEHREDWSDWVAGDPPEAVVGAAIAALGLRDNATNRKAVRPAVKKAVDSMAGGMVLGRNVLVIPRDTVADFRERVAADHRLASAMAVTAFPPRPPAGCRGCAYTRACTFAGVTDGEDDEDE
ncbi:MAG: PD-(D/E)XK nuclease family protein [Euryarchaeota archaeon]|nr:PD-(D/E)XK nuclease family protein [Euryarchaeota archaeon]